MSEKILVIELNGKKYLVASIKSNIYELIAIDLFDEHDIAIPIINVTKDVLEKNNYKVLGSQYLYTLLNYRSSKVIDMLKEYLDAK